jgi:hypothetical protein
MVITPAAKAFVLSLAELLTNQGAENLEDESRIIRHTTEIKLPMMEVVVVRANYKYGQGSEKYRIGGDAKTVFVPAVCALEVCYMKSPQHLKSANDTLSQIIQLLRNSNYESNKNNFQYPSQWSKDFVSVYKKTA